MFKEPKEFTVITANRYDRYDSLCHVTIGVTT